MLAAGIVVEPDDLAQVVKAGCNGNAAGSQRIVERGEIAAAATEETVGAAGVIVKPDDLATIVDPVGIGDGSGRGIVEVEIGAPAQEEAVLAAGVVVEPDDSLMPVATVTPPVANGSSSVVNWPLLLRRKPWVPLASS